MVGERRWKGKRESQHVEGVVLDVTLMHMSLMHMVTKISAKLERKSLVSARPRFWPRMVGF